VKKKTNEIYKINIQLGVEKKNKIISDSSQSLSVKKEEENEEKKKLKSFQSTLHTIFKEIKKYDNSNFSEKALRNSETNNASNKNTTNIIEKINIDSNNYNDDNDNRLKHESENNRHSSNFENYIAKKDRFLSKFQIIF